MVKTYLVKTFRVIGPLLWAFFLTPQNGHAANEDELGLMCIGRGGYNENVCHVSMHSLIATPEKYDKKLVLINGYFADGQYPLLFISKEAYEISNIPDSIGLEASGIKPDFKKRLYELNRRYISIVGRFRMKGISTSDATGNRTSGAIAELLEVGPSRGPWGYQEPMPSMTLEPKDKH